MALRKRMTKTETGVGPGLKFNSSLSCPVSSKVVIYITGDTLAPFKSRLSEAEALVSCAPIGKPLKGIALQSLAYLGCVHTWELIFKARSGPLLAVLFMFLEQSWLILFL